jgi:hypothetical protein
MAVFYIEKWDLFYNFTAPQQTITLHHIRMNGEKMHDSDRQLPIEDLGLNVHGFRAECARRWVGY